MQPKYRFLRCWNRTMAELKPHLYTVCLVVMLILVENKVYRYILSDTSGHLFFGER